MWHDSFIWGRGGSVGESWWWGCDPLKGVWHSYVTWLIHMRQEAITHYMTLSVVTWLVHTWHDSFMCVTWLIHMCDVAHTHVTWLMYTWHDSRICDMTHTYVIFGPCVRDMAHSYVPWLMHRWHGAFIWKWLIHTWHGAYVYGLATMSRLLKIIGLFCRI